mmetsp:Transcript_25328/g.60531  ORF Transcript_25328/g.60531 Transcript_25328/m.60531 type:complete len:290 (-) Transcript_25328:479-1348(-)
MRDSSVMRSMSTSNPSFSFSAPSAAWAHLFFSRTAASRLSFWRASSSAARAEMLCSCRRSDNCLSSLSRFKISCSPCAALMLLMSLFATLSLTRHSSTSLSCRVSFTTSRSVLPRPSILLRSDWSFSSISPSSSESPSASACISTISRLTRSGDLTTRLCILATSARRLRQSSWALSRFCPLSLRCCFTSCTWSFSRNCSTLSFCTCAAISALPSSSSVRNSCSSARASRRECSWVVSSSNRASTSSFSVLSDSDSATRSSKRGIWSSRYLAKLVMAENIFLTRSAVGW